MDGFVDMTEAMDQRSMIVPYLTIEYGSTKDVIIETTILCPDSPDCCGCINGKRNKEGVIIFSCNECGQEVGRGVER